MIQYIIIGVIVFLAIVFKANATTAIVRREDKSGYFPDWLIFIGGMAMFFIIVSFPILFLMLKETQEQVKNPVQYELVEEPLYRVK